MHLMNQGIAFYSRLEDSNSSHRGCLLGYFRVVHSSEEPSRGHMTIRAQPLTWSRLPARPLKETAAALRRYLDVF